jgi:hypothetical protein
MITKGYELNNDKQICNDWIKWKKKNVVECYKTRAI